MMHKASPFTASCNGLIDMDDETDEVADPAGTVFSGIDPSHLIIEVPSKVPQSDDVTGEDDDGDGDNTEEDEEEEAQPRLTTTTLVDDVDGTEPADYGVKTDPAMCVVLTALVLVVPLLRSQRRRLS
jgi:hypothetical protein